LRKRNGEILTYPNSLVLQKGVDLVSEYDKNLDDQFEQQQEIIADEPVHNI